MLSNLTLLVGADVIICKNFQYSLSRKDYQFINTLYRAILSIDSKRGNKLMSKYNF